MNTRDAFDFCCPVSTVAVKQEEKRKDLPRSRSGKDKEANSVPRETNRLTLESAPQDETTRPTTGQ